MLHPEAQQFLDHSSRNELIELSIYHECLVPHSGNVVCSKGSCLEDDIFEGPLEDVYGQFYLEKDVVTDT